MSFLDWFKPGKSSEPAPEFEPLTQEEFNIALSALAQHETLETEEVIAEMVRAGISEAKAGELYLFLPTAFCRRLIPEAGYLDEYVDYYGDKKQIKRSFKANRLYAQIIAYTDAYFTHGPEQGVIFNVAGISAEFNTINQALHGGSEIKNLQFAPLYIVR